MGAVVLDTGVVIGFLDPADARNPRAIQALAEPVAGGDELLLAASTYAEVLVHPLRRGTEAGVERFVDQDGVRIVGVDRALGRAAAELRARHRSLRLGDAVTLAVARTHGARLLTFDERLHRIARALHG